MMLNIIVVGASMAGLTLSIGLAKLGYSVDLVERRHDLRKRNGATFYVQPNAIKALEEICPQVTASLEDKTGRLVETGGMVSMWWTVRDALLEEAEKYQDKIKFWPGWTFTEFVDDSSKPCVLAKFTRTEGQHSDHDNGSDSNMEMKGCMLVGADGVHSSVRSALNLPPAEFAGSVFWRGTIIVPEDSEALRPFLDKDNPALFGVAGPTVFTLFTHHKRIPGAMCFSVASKDPDALIRPHPIEVIQPYMDPNDERLNVLQQVFELADPDEIKYSIKCETIRPPEEDGKGWGGKGRVTLLGDSAHAMRPAGGYGAALAFEDCVILCRLLKELDADTNKDYLSIDKTIRQFENSRLPRVRRIWDIQWKAAENSYKQARSPPDSNQQEYFQWVFKGV